MFNRAKYDAPPETLKELLKLGAIGYVKGIHEKLDEIERGDRRYTHFVTELRELVKQFRLVEFSRSVAEKGNASSGA